MGRILNEAGGALLNEAGGNLLTEGGGGGAAAALSGSGTLTSAATVTAPQFTAVASPSSGTAHTFSLTPHAVGNFFLVGVLSETTADYATALSSSNVTWTVLVAHHAFTSNVVAQTLFIGVATSTSTATVTISFAAGNPTTRTAWQEFSSSLGYSAVTLDASGTVDVASAGSFPGIATGHGAGELYWGYLFDAGTGTAGSTSGFSYYIDANGNPVTWNAACGSGTQHPNIGDTSDGVSGTAVLLYQAITLLSGGASLSGSGTLAAAVLLNQRPAVTLAGSGTLGGSPALAVPAAAVLLGNGTLTSAASVMAPGGVSAVLSGTGTLSAPGVIGWGAAAALTGSGTLTAVRTGTVEQGAALSGSGTLTVAAAAALKITAGLFGAGFLSIPQVAGGLVNGVGGASVPQALPGSSQVAVAPPGSSNWQWLGTLGQVTALTYSYVCPGGCDKMSMTIMCPASFRTQLFNPGWQVKITRGGHQVWDGKLDEPQPSAQGWTLTAVGQGNRGTDYTAYYSIDDTWPEDEPDEIINRAIGRGLPWVNPGYNGTSIASQMWMGQGTDPGSQTVTAFLNLLCTRGGLTWYVNSQPGGIYGADDLNIFPLPTAPNRLLVSTTPVARTLGGYVNSLVIRFQQTADNTTTNVAATYGVVDAINSQSVAAHGTLEAYVDLSDVGVQTATQAQAVGNAILQAYQAAAFAGPFTVSYGQLLNMGGQPVDIGTDQAGGMVKLVLTDYAYGGSVTPNNPVVFIVGSYTYDDFTQTAQVVPYQALDQSLTGMLSAFNTVNTPITVAST